MEPHFTDVERLVTDLNAKGFTIKSLYQTETKFLVALNWKGRWGYSYGEGKTLTRALRSAIQNVIDNRAGFSIAPPPTAKERTIIHKSCKRIMKRHFRIKERIRL